MQRIADDLAAKLMTPENLSLLLKSGPVRNAAENFTFGTMWSLAEFDISNIFALAGRITFVKPVESALRLGGGQEAGSISMHLEGPTWKLSGSGLPPKVLTNLVDRLPAMRLATKRFRNLVRVAGLLGGPVLQGLRGTPLLSGHPLRRRLQTRLNGRDVRLGPGDAPPKALAGIQVDATVPTYL